VGGVSISLCVIARDEEALIGACLDSARGVADEALVVDTGSADATARAAREHGARVETFQWRDDFAAARNVGLERARGSHVLVLDADEVLAPSAGAALRRAAADPRTLLCLLPLHDADALDAPVDQVLSGARRMWDPSWVGRFFRNDPRVRFRRRVHETVLAGVNECLTAGGGVVDALEAPIVHFGEVRALRERRDKARRNTRLLELALREDPGDGELAGYLAHEHYRQGRVPEARDVALRAFRPYLERLDAMPASVLKPVPVALGSALAVCQMQLCDAAGALATVVAAAARCTAPHPNLRFLEGVALERLGRPAEAERCLRDCLAMDGRRQLVPLNPGVTGPAARLRLANVLLSLGRPREALAECEGLAGEYEAAGRLARAEAELALGAPERALTTLAPLMSDADPAPDLFALASGAAQALGQADPAFAAAARGAPPARWIERRRARFVAE